MCVIGKYDLYVFIGNTEIVTNLTGSDMSYNKPLAGTTIYKIHIACVYNHCLLKKIHFVVLLMFIVCNVLAWNNLDFKI